MMCESEIKILLNLNSQLEKAIIEFQQGEKLQEEKSFSEAIARYNEAKKHFNTADCEMRINQCLEGIKVENEVYRPYSKKIETISRKYSSLYNKVVDNLPPLIKEEKIYKLENF